MSKIGQIMIEIDELVEQGMSPKFIATVLNIPMEWVYEVIDERAALEEQKRFGCMNEEY